MRKKKETAKRIVGNERNKYQRKLGKNVRINLSNFVNLIVKACKNIIKSNNFIKFNNLDHENKQSFTKIIRRGTFFDILTKLKRKYKSECSRSRK